MRSRYSAYVLGQLDYLESSWHPRFRPPGLTRESRLRWLGLDIIDFIPAGESATVEFEARFLAGGVVDALHESSRFVREGGRWLYTDGERLAPSFTPWKPGRNEACPCGSGRKFKRCCAAA